MVQSNEANLKCFLSMGNVKNKSYEEVHKARLEEAD
jgi:hypothetical protein